MESLKKFHSYLYSSTPIYIEQLKTPYNLVYDEGLKHMYAKSGSTTYSLDELEEELQSFLDENSFLWEAASNFVGGKYLINVNNIEWNYIEEVRVMQGHLNFINDLLLQRNSNINAYTMGLQIARESYLSFVNLYNKNGKYFSSNILGKMVKYFSSTILIPSTFAELELFNSYLEIERIGLDSEVEGRPEPKLVRPNCDARGNIIYKEGLNTSVFTIMDILNKLKMYGLKGADIELLARMKPVLIELLTVNTCPSLLEKKGILCVLDVGTKLKYTVNSPICFFPCGDELDKVQEVIDKYKLIWQAEKDIKQSEIRVIPDISYLQVLYLKCGFKSFSIKEFYKILRRWADGN